MRVVLVHNKKAGSADLSKKQLVAALESAGYEVVYRSKSQLDRLGADARRSELILVAGGDGTVAKVAKRLAGRDVPVAVLPLGTANNIADSLGTPRDTNPLSIIARLPRAARRPFDLGRASGARRKDVFLESAGGGLFAELLAEAKARADRREREPHFATRDDAIAHALAELREVLRRAEPQEWQVELDGVDHSGRYLLVEAMNIRSIGPNLLLAPNANVEDGLFNVVLLKESHRGRFDDYLRHRLAGSKAAPRLPVLRARTVTLAPRGGGSLHVDDRLWPPSKGKRQRGSSAGMHLRLDGHALTFAVPTKRRSPRR